MSKNITNTAVEAERNPARVLLGAMVNPDNHILDQESQGQRELVESDQLPTEVYGDRNELEDAGVVFGDPCKDDPLFCDVTLPEGWKKRATDHSMWSELVDDEGVVRAKIFYKAAFYDRGASLNVCRPDQ